MWGWGIGKWGTVRYYTRMVWKAPRLLFVLAMAVVSCLVFGHHASAAEVTERHVFYLDWGFVGRPVSLDVNGGKTVVSWDAGDLTAPTILMVEIEKDTEALAPANVQFGNEVVHVTWADPYLLSARGVKVTNEDGCQPSNWSTCTLYREEAGVWKEAAGGRVYGHVRARMGTKQGNYMRAGSASWYKYKNCHCAASPDFPKGTRLLVRSVANPEKFTVIRVNDFGPERDKFPDRAIDLDVVAFKELAPLGAGVIRVTVEPLASTDPRYALADAPVPVATTVPPVVKPAPVPVATVPETPTWSY